MAKLGKGDPRWIVEEREDAKNVNNWHWTERDISQWSKDKFKQLFEGVTFGTEDVIHIKIKSLSSAKGEGVINNRKGKLLFFYEWDLNLE
ncbi:activator of Hsp90 ATPase N-terminal domain-containing protein, partial [Salmonella sp. s51228]|uniref:activator of Hsp90 ATPase N-terminal domain-containing protein n=1 Tax=Salmonella sp. s51228 TaxID=3159652 RepID=UPI003980523F